MSKHASDDSAFILAAFDRVLMRRPGDDELKTCLKFLKTQAGRLSDTTKLTVSEGDEPKLKPSADAAQRARENLVHVLFNHNDFVAIR